MLLTPKLCNGTNWFPIENGIIAAGFLLCDMEDFDDIGLTKFGKKRLLDAFKEVKH